MDSSATVKRLIGKGSDLYLGLDGNGTMWATNRYWAVPAYRVCPLLNKFNLSGDEPGRYEVNGTVRKMSSEGPKVGTLVNLADYTIALEAVKVDGQPAFVRPGGNNFLAVYTKPDGAHLVVNQEWLSWGLGDGTNKRVVTDGHRVGVIEYDAEEVKPGHWDREAGRHVPGEYREVNHRLVAVIMPSKLPS